MTQKSAGGTAKTLTITPSDKATNADLELFFGKCGDDTRRRLLRLLGLPKRRKYPWSEIWHALGLSPDQPKPLWNDLTLGDERQNFLWSAARVADEIGLSSDTVNAYCNQDRRPEGFPAPLLSAGPKTRLWLPLEVRAYNQPSLYAALASEIRRLPKSEAASKAMAAVPKSGSLDPLPPRPGG